MRREDDAELCGAYKEVFIAFGGGRGTAQAKAEDPIGRVWALLSSMNAQ